MSTDFDVCVIGSGAGGGAVAHALSRAGFSVVVLEKGPWLRDADFVKDEVAVARRELYTPRRDDEPHVVETYDSDDGWSAQPTAGTGWDFWNGSLVGGASNLMSGFFHRLKPDDFRLLSAYGPIRGAQVADWPIGYDDLEPWYALVEREVGVSGRVVAHPHADRRSTADFPMPPLLEHPLAQRLERACRELGAQAVPVPRAVLSAPVGARGACSYTGFCASYGCSTGAKGSSRAALLEAAVASGRCEVRARCTARRITTDAAGKITGVEYQDAGGRVQRVDARVYVVACQAIETARLLLLSRGPRHEHGLGNRRGQVGRNLIFSTAAWARADIPLGAAGSAERRELESGQPWINRAVMDWYTTRDPDSGRKEKGGLLEFMRVHPNRISQAVTCAFEDGEPPLWGVSLKRRLEHHFRDTSPVVVEVFADWLPTLDGRVTLDPEVKDRHGRPVARVRIDRHPHNKRVADRLLEHGVRILKQMGGENLVTSSRGAPATNLPAGGCRFGVDPAVSVLDRDCRVHDVDNLYVTDASFMPTAGSVPPTWTVYANAFRVADKIRQRL